MILFSAFQSNESEVNNIKNTVKVKAFFEFLNIPYRIVLGSYQGSEEISFQVDDDQLERVLYLASIFNQESILVVEKNGSSTLLYTNQDELPQLDLGTWIKSTIKDAGDAFTVIGNTVFTVKGDV